MTRSVPKLFASLALAATLVAAAAAAEFPSKPVRLVVPFAAGGTFELEARLIAAKLQENWRQPIIVEARPGANTILGVDYVAKSAPDGHTMVLHASSIVATPQMQRTPYDFLRDLRGVAQTAEVRYILAASQKIGVSTVDELVALAKKDPDRLNYGSSGNGTPLHLYVELFKRAAGVNLTHVPYKGNGPAMQALLAGDVHLVFDISLSIIPLVKAGKVRPLMVTGSKPMDVLPQVPAFNAVYPGNGIDGWHGIFVPAATPKAVIDQMAADLRTAVLSPDLMKRFREIGFESTGVTSDRFGEIVRSDYERWGQIIRANNIRVD
ncbi:MAG: tripartite tricarboxylate transporter substrate binding protein [Betaproteobacteria bacterium]|nr:tripartite tricarboxylate transporter substrate binding protein [Betaproteobacteria bacterium]